MQNTLTIFSALMRKMRNKHVFTIGIYVILLVCSHILLAQPSSRPTYPAGTIQSKVRQCQEKDQLMSKENCELWIQRRSNALAFSCGDPKSKLACNSFKELVGAEDSNLVWDFGTADHLYVCFREKEDVFFNLRIPEPSPTAWRKESEGRRTLTQPGGVGLSYFKSGIYDKDAEASEFGKWTYEPLAPEINFSELRKLATISNANFHGSQMDVDGTEFTASEIYVNQLGTKTKHDIAVELATGRFTETFTILGIQQNIDRQSGRCLVMPKAIQ
jgi:hypothetical protein